MIKISKEQLEKHFKLVDLREKQINATEKLIKLMGENDLAMFGEKEE